jgi:hypothetical protein
METMTVPSTEKRLDDLRAEIHQGFNRVDADIRELRVEGRELRSEMKAGFEKVDGEFKSVRAEMKASFDESQRLMLGFFATTLGAIIAAAIVNVILSHS